MDKDDKVSMMVALGGVGIVFRLLYALIDFKLIGLVWVAIEGMLSGLGVGLGVLLAISYQEKILEVLKDEWKMKVIPYLCGGVGVFLWKLAKKFIIDEFFEQSQGTKGIK